jgi:uncharacterized protein YicC (UPF0701 family)
VKRGNLAVTLTVDDAASQGRLTVNREALEQIMGVIAEFGGKISAEPPRLDGILALKGVLDVELPKIDEAEARNARKPCSAASARRSTGWPRCARSKASAWPICSPRT